MDEKKRTGRMKREEKKKRNEAGGAAKTAGANAFLVD